MDQRTIGRLVAAGLTVAAAIGLAVGWRRHGRGRRGTAAAHEPWTCDCGQLYRVTGEGRHRVYWLDGASDGDPVMGTACVACERPLPA